MTGQELAAVDDELGVKSGWSQNALDQDTIALRWLMATDTDNTRRNNR
jgi:hypothetical protein